MPTLIPIALTSTPGVWRVYSARKLDKAFMRFAETVWERDQYRCRYCGFQARHHQDVVNIDKNYTNNTVANMATACCFCAQCFFIDAVGKSDVGGGHIIYLPEISQNRLNGLCHVLFCALANATAYADQAQSILRDLKLRSRVVEQALGDGMSQPANLGQALIDARIKDKQGFQSILLKDLRLLPSRAKFESNMQAWSAEGADDLSAPEEST